MGVSGTVWASRFGKHPWVGVFPNSLKSAYRVARLGTATG